MQSLQKSATDAGAIWLSVISLTPGKQGHVDGEEADALAEAMAGKPVSEPTPAPYGCPVKY